MTASWTTEIYSRTNGKSAGDFDRYFYDESGKRRALGLAKAPAKLIKGEMTKTGLAPGEAPAVVKYEKKAKTFASAVEAMQIEGDFAEFTSGVEIKKRKYPKKWRPVLQNSYTWPASKDNFGPSIPAHEWPRCDCDPEVGCGENCVNRQLMTECALGYCRGGRKKKYVCGGGSDDHRRADELEAISGTTRIASRLRKAQQDGGGSSDYYPCGNTVIQRRLYPPCEIFDTGDENKGFALRCCVDAKAGTLFGEYRGEVIVAEELRKRQKDRDPTEAFYFASLGEGLYVDATHRGGYARFANHSCNPNCELEKWTVGQEPRLVLRATRDIPKLTELCYDYNAGGGVQDVTHAQKCRCGAYNCSGTIGAKAKKDGEIESDDDSQKPALNRRRAALKRKRTQATTVAAKAKGKGAAAKKTAGRQPKETSKKTVSAAQRKISSPKKYRKGDSDGPKSIGWARETLRKLSGIDGAADAPYGLASRLDPAVRRHDARTSTSESKEALICFCRLPESIGLPQSLLRPGNEATIICCDICERWYHPTCIRQVDDLSIEDGFTCAMCRHRDGDAGGLLAIAKSSNKDWWVRMLPRATRAACESALADEDRVSDGDCFGRMAFDFLGRLVEESNDWVRSAESSLKSNDVSLLAELICRGQMLEVIDSGKLITRLKRSLAAAATATP